MVPNLASEIDPRLLANSRVLSSRRDILPLLPRNQIFAEVGVGLGDFSERVFSVCDVKKFIAIDLFVLHKAPHVWGGQGGRILGERTHREYYSERFQNHLDGGKLEIMQGDSIACLKKLPDCSVDIFYLDADHSYTSVKGELDVVKAKIRPRGWIILNDYVMEDWITKTRYGVVQAVNEFMNRERWELIYFALHNGMYCDVAIQKCAA